MFKTKKQLKEEIARLEKEKAEINQERLSLLKNREINYNLYNMLKAVLMQLPAKEIRLSTKGINTGFSERVRIRIDGRTEGLKFAIEKIKEMEEYKI